MLMSVLLCGICRGFFWADLLNKSFGAAFHRLCIFVKILSKINQIVNFLTNWHVSGIIKIGHWMIPKMYFSPVWKPRLIADNKNPMCLIVSCLSKSCSICPPIVSLITLQRKLHIAGFVETCCNVLLIMSHVTQQVTFLKGITGEQSSCLNFAK